MELLDHYDQFSVDDNDAMSLDRLSSLRCRKHPRSVSFDHFPPIDFDGLANDLTYGHVNTVIKGVLLCPRCLGENYLEIIVNARQTLRRAGIAMPLTRLEREWQCGGAS